ncbi:MAG: cold-shock protein [Chloroflexi bacterium HGW-Chloroflexi-5]|jgi:CspA family cold shock protein|nr:MAG: cold-shock protein [Chloroflexi bacterium HGW-Chloroflexi-5]PKP09831.1 MAG: cold-shock protein [Bacteroidetes bacterium HGW-Bacteroidetes-4]
MQGAVKWYNETKGFGFIIGEDQKEIFVHRSGIVSKHALQPGETVEFEIKAGEKGPMATQVTVIK